MINVLHLHDTCEFTCDTARLSIAAMAIPMTLPHITMIFERRRCAHENCEQVQRVSAKHKKKPIAANPKYFGHCGNKEVSSATHIDI